MRNQWVKQSGAAVLLLMAACTPVMDGVQKAGEQSKLMIADTKKSWGDLFTYQPKTAPQLPQTRYCYHTMTDVVCYDSPQSTTSHLDGYQDGENISWVQPGGGSLGASGGEPTAQANAEHAQVAPTAKLAASGGTDLRSSDTISSTPIAPPVAAASDSVTATAPDSTSGPFYRKESPYAK